MMRGKFEIYNFGCKVNQQEGGALAALFTASGWQRATDDAVDLVIINTCTVTQVADKKARNLIRRLRKQHPHCILAVCGCYAQRAAAEIAALGGVDIIAGVDERARLPELVAQHLAENQRQIATVSEISQAKQFVRIAEHSTQQRTRAYLKIEDGCDQFCHYCIIPYVRGPVRSLPVAQVLEEAQALLDEGFAEIVLSGIHVGAYGADFGQVDGLAELLPQLLRLPGLLRLRLGSIEPQQFTPRLLQVLAESKKLCPHFHIPLQSGSDRTLAAMGRHYDSGAYANLLAELRSRLGDVAITSDVMVGYPGETAADFAASQAFCESCGFAGLHIFPYSRREGTVAAGLPEQVPQKVKAERAAALAGTAERAAEAYESRYLGRELVLLAEEQVSIAGKTYWRGHSGNYLQLLLATETQPPAPCVVRPYEKTAQGLLCELVEYLPDVNFIGQFGLLV